MTKEDLRKELINSNEYFQENNEFFNKIFDKLDSSIFERWNGIPRTENVNIPDNSLAKLISTLRVYQEYGD